MSTRSKFCIVGIPDHQAVIGRVGAQQGPAAFKKAFSKLSGRCPIKNILDSEIEVSSLSHDVEKNHQEAARVIQQCHEKLSYSVVVGGGHDHGYSHLLGIHQALSSNKKKVRIGCINIDAHLDVRKPSPQITSGSPFYLALESKILEPSRFIEFGIQSHCNASILWEYVKLKKVKVFPFQDLRHGKAVKVFQSEIKKLALKSDAIVISLDLDAAASAYAPGVSAPQSEGFTASEILAMVEIAGKEKKCISLGIFELNPMHDQDAQTARLAATAAYHFIESTWLAKKIMPT